MNLFSEFDSKSLLPGICTQSSQLSGMLPVKSAVIYNQSSYAGSSSRNIFRTGHNLDINSEVSRMEYMERNRCRICQQRYSGLMCYVGKSLQIGHFQLRIGNNFQKKRTSISINLLLHFFGTCQVTEAYFYPKSFQCTFQK